MNNSLKKLLLPYQIDHTIKLSEKLSANHICFDCSDTGTGKTYAAIASAKYLKMKVFVVCPKTILSSWKNVISLFNVKCLGISNYELLIRGKYYKENNTKICPYIEKTSDQQMYNWKIPDNTLIIFDEVHRCCGDHTYTSNLLLSLMNVYDEKHPLLLITATICDGPHKFKLFSVLLKWYTSVNSVPNWLEKTYNPTAASKIIKQRLSIKNMCKISISELGDLFQKNQVSADYYDIKKSDMDEIDKLHQSIIEHLESIKNKSLTDRASGWAFMTRTRQRIELLKVQIFVDLVEQYLDNNFSVVIFVNYTDTLKLLSTSLKTNCLVFGEQKIEDRLRNIENFLKDKERIIICNIQCGSDSISLNDKNGKYQRVSLISPPLSSLKLIQACGRICRTDSKTASFNKIIFANSTIEKKLCNKLKGKCSLYSTITDTDLMYEIDKDI